MTATTLADKLKEFSSVKLKKATIKVPKLGARKEKSVKRRADEQKKSNAHISSTLSSIINILMKATTQRAKKSETGKPAAQEKIYKAVNDDGTLSANKGYAAFSRNYDNFPNASYANYKRLFSNHGWFRAKGQYEHQAEGHVAMANKSLEDARFTILNAETLDRITKYIKYFRGGYIDALSLVPKAGMNSAEWEELRLMAKIDPVTYGFKTGHFLRL